MNNGLKLESVNKPTKTTLDNRQPTIYNPTMRVTKRKYELVITQDEDGRLELTAGVTEGDKMEMDLFQIVVSNIGTFAEQTLNTMDAANDVALYLHRAEGGCDDGADE